MTRTLPTYFAALLLLTACSLPGNRTADHVVISIVGTNDVHGQLRQKGELGGLTTTSGYLNSLRTARSEDGGAVLLIDAGDMWQGTLESNLTEGAAVVAAYNALNYTAATIGNHEFDFGPLGPDAIPMSPGADPRGALKQRATEAAFPLLAANLIDTATNSPVSWPNVQPSVVVEASGIKVGIIGVMTANALQTTIAANVIGLRVAPLAPTIEKEAQALRTAGADLVIVTAHAGGRCSTFTNPRDLSSCNQAGEIFAVARALPAGLVDHIIAGHVHQGIAHIVNGTSITSSYSNTYAFSRVDFDIDTLSGDIKDRRIFPPTPLRAAASYEGVAVHYDDDVVAIADRATKFASDQIQRRLGIRLETPFTLEGNPESALGNLFTDALLEATDVDVVIHNVAGGLRTDLPAGELTFGSVYELSPFENRLVRLSLTGAELREVVARAAHRGERSIGFSGMRVFIACENKQMTVRVLLSNGQNVDDDTPVSILVNDYIALGGDNILTSIIPDDGFNIDGKMPLTRDLFVDWLANRGGSINAADYQTNHAPKWNRPDFLDPECRLN